MKSARENRSARRTDLDGHDGGPGGRGDSPPAHRRQAPPHAWRRTASSRVRTCSRSIDFASTGDTITIKGTCVGNFQIPGGGTATSLTLLGKGRGGKPILDGATTGSVVAVSGANVTVKNLLVTNGLASYTGGGSTHQEATSP